MEGVEVVVAEVGVVEVGVVWKIETKEWQPAD